MKPHMLFVAGSALLLAACSQATNATTPEREVAPESESPPAQEAVQAESEPRIVTIRAEDWAFIPDSVSFQKGENAMIRLEGISGTHGFMVSGLSINVTIQPGETVDVPIPTDVPGTYAFRCSIPCGDGHMDMKGTIVIEE